MEQLPVMGARDSSDGPSGGDIRMSAGSRANATYLNVSRLLTKTDRGVDNRAVCRFCRYTRCINAGMREEQVQNERDVIGKRNRTNSATSTKGRPIPMKRRQSSEDG